MRITKKMMTIFGAWVFANTLFAHGLHHHHAHPFSSEETQVDGKKLVAPVATNDAEEGLLTNIQQLTFAGARAGESYFSPDGEWMIFQSEREKENPFYQIYLMNLKNGKVERMSPGIGKTTCAWIHPSKTKVLFASTHLDPDAVKKQQEEIAARESGTTRRYEWDFDEHFDIFQSDTRGRRLKNLTHTPGYDAEGSWSPNGKLIAFASNRRAYTEQLSPEEQEIFKKDKSYFMDLYVMDADGRNVRQLTSSPGYDGGPFFSSDGERIIWRRFSADGSKAEVYSIKVDGTDEKALTNLGVLSWAPYYHPTKDYVVFATNLQGHANFEVYLVDAGGTKEPIRVTFTDGFDGLPVFLPDGRHIAWTSTRAPGKKSQIFIADWNDAAARKLLGLPVRKPDLQRMQADITAEDIEQHVRYLASDELEGRMTASKGELLATEYASEAFEKFGLKPQVVSNYFHSFEYTAGVSLDSGNRLAIAKDSTTSELEVSGDFLPLAFSKNGEFEGGEVVFGGYGIIAPKSEKFPEYNSYTHLDVKDKWVLIFRYLPEGISVEHRQHLYRYSDLRQKAMEARNLGAAGLIVVSGPNSKVHEQLIPLKSDVSAAGSSIFGLSVTDAAGERLLAGQEKTLQALQDELDKGETVMGFPLLTKVSGNIAIKKEKKTGRNVLARLDSRRTYKEAIIIGAHLDHLGKDEKGIYHGADDNASGSAAVLEIAQKVADSLQEREIHLQKEIIFALWSGEELGLLGSSAFVKDYLEAKGGTKIVAAINMDMIGRLKDQLIIQGVGSSSVWPRLLEKHNARSPLRIITQEDPYLPTDSTAFYLQQIPGINAFTGSHEDYHLPSDTFEKINYEGVEETAKLIADIAVDLASSRETPDYIKVEGRTGQGGFRVYLGTIPDYTAGDNIVGVLLSGVKAGSPAEKSGLKAGDIITSLAGQKIENVYDYTYVLSALKVAEEVEIKFLREGKEIVAKITPESRS